MPCVSGIAGKVSEMGADRPRVLVVCESPKCGTLRRRGGNGLCRVCYDERRRRGVCGNNGCDRPHYAKGLCRPCYRPQYTRPIITCKECGRSQPHWGKGMCKKCYGGQCGKCNDCGGPRSRNNDRGLCLACYAARRLNRKCTRMGCSNPHKAHGLCSTCGMRLSRRLKGVLPLHRAVGRSRGNWGGGRIVYCDQRDCGRLVGWRTPFKLERNNGFGFWCSEHRRGPNWGGGRIEGCAVPGCDRDAGWRSPSDTRANKTGFRCSEHRRVHLKESDYEDSKEVRSPMAQHDYVPREAAQAVQ